jgi:hypothetical protein
MERSTNALAELAEDLEEIVRDTKSDFYTTAISKAQRIVAELAKVNTLGPKHIPGDISLYTAYAKCRAIAEEGGAK